MTIEGPLTPVGAALLASARREADAVLADADDEVAAELAEAQGRADAILSEAAAQGAADAEAVMRTELLRARREARGVVLRAQEQARGRLRSEVHARLRALREDPAYPELREALAARARADLGPGAAVEDDPSGGVVATDGSRRASYSLAALADRVLDGMGGEVEGLWTIEDPS